MNIAATATTKYQLNLPFVLLQASPQLAALHASRARLLNPSDATLLNPTHCSKCGSFLLNGDGDIRVTRLKRKLDKKKGPDDAPRRVLRTVCRICGCSNDLPVDRGNLPSSSNPRRWGSTVVHQATSGRVEDPLKTANQKQKVDRVLLPPQSPSVTSERPESMPISAGHGHTPSTSARSKTRPKKRSGLQDMLERNREKEAQEKRKDGQSSSLGLSAFLSDL